ncbi:MAG: hypothetical protein HC781_18385 [Leptolyngbyaceae cyanobacterium CSU_1_4]|nr:hypothetical protein [Leptolyngbyaceae cyanobacterium CSU_1_4]
MGFSDDVEQQRASEVKLLRRWVGWGLASSFLMHGLSLPLVIRDSRKASTRPTEITIVPRQVPPAPQKLKPIPAPEPEIEPKLNPQLEPEQPSQTLSTTVAESQILPPGVMPERDRNTLQDGIAARGFGIGGGGRRFCRRNWVKSFDKFGSRIGEAGRVVGWREAYRAESLRRPLSLHRCPQRSRNSLNLCLN